MCGFYRKHIENFSNLASPLTNLTRKNQPFEWTEECDNAFVELKDRLTSSLILAKADLTQRFFLETDASQNYVAAVLLQYDLGNIPHTVAYFSKKLRPVEARYSTTDREALAIVLACLYHL